MLTMCRTLMGDPDLVLIDEPTESRRRAWWSRQGCRSPRLRAKVSRSCWSIVFEGTAAALQADAA